MLVIHKPSTNFFLWRRSLQTLFLYFCNSLSMQEKILSLEGLKESEKILINNESKLFDSLSSSNTERSSSSQSHLKFSSVVSRIHGGIRRASCILSTWRRLCSLAEMRVVLYQAAQAY